MMAVVSDMRIVAIQPDSARIIKNEEGRAIHGKVINMRILLFTFVIISCVQTSPCSDKQRAFSDSTIQSVKDMGLHGYRDSTSFDMHGFALGEMSFNIYFEKMLINDSTHQIITVGRVMDSMTGELLDHVWVAMGKVDSSDGIGIINPVNRTNTMSNGRFTMSGTIQNESKIFFMLPGYLVSIFDIGKLVTLK